MSYLDFFDNSEMRRDPFQEDPDLLAASKDIFKENLAFTEAIQ